MAAIRQQAMPSATLGLTRDGTTLPESEDNRAHRPPARRCAAAGRQSSPFCLSCCSRQSSTKARSAVSANQRARAIRPVCPAATVCDWSGAKTLQWKRSAPRARVSLMMPRAWHSGSTSNSALGLTRRHSCAALAGPPGWIRNSRANRRRSSARPSGTRTVTLRSGAACEARDRGGRSLINAYRAGLLSTRPGTSPRAAHSGRKWRGECANAPRRPLQLPRTRRGSRLPSSPRRRGSNSWSPSG
jgi:hypothetical protein